MQEKIDSFRQHVTEASSNPNFVHHMWFIKWHLEIVERIAEELLVKYPDADKDLVRVMVWLHDYGKILDFDRQYEVTLSEGAKKLLEIGFENEFVKKAVSNIEILDKKMELDIAQTSIEVQIVSSADGCSHIVGPFMYLWWYENANKPFEELMSGNLRKLTKDWDRKIVLPEARAAFKKYQNVTAVQNGALPEKFLEA